MMKKQSCEPSKKPFLDRSTAKLTTIEVNGANKKNIYRPFILIDKQHAH